MLSTNNTNIIYHTASAQACCFINCCYYIHIFICIVVSLLLFNHNITTTHTYLGLNVIILSSLHNLLIASLQYYQLIGIGINHHFSCHPVIMSSHTPSITRTAVASFQVSNNACQLVKVLLSNHHHHCISGCQ